MSETKAKYKVKHGGTRTPGPGRKIGKPAEIGTNGKIYANYLDDETIIILRAIHPIRSQAIRMAAKQYKF
jgi:hypothetical protein